MCINFNYYLLFILHAFTCTVAYFIFINILHGCKGSPERANETAYVRMRVQFAICSAGRRLLKINTIRSLSISSQKLTN